MDEYTAGRLDPLWEKAKADIAAGRVKPWKQGWADKKTVRDIRHAQHAEQQLHEIGS